jgi:hypothetical protein
VPRACSGGYFLAQPRAEVGDALERVGFVEDFQRLLRRGERHRVRHARVARGQGH